MTMPPSYPPANVSGADADTAPDLKNHLTHSHSDGTSSSTVTPRVIFDFRHPPIATATDTVISQSRRIAAKKTTTTITRGEGSPKNSKRLHPVQQWKPIPPLRSSFSTLHSPKSKRVHNIMHDDHRSAHTALKKQRTSSSFSRLPQLSRRSRGDIFHRLLRFTLFIAFVITVPILFSSCIHLGWCANVVEMNSRSRSDRTSFVLSPQTTVQESACYVSFLVTTHVLHHLPENTRSFLLWMHRFVGSIIDEVQQLLPPFVSKKWNAFFPWTMISSSWNTAMKYYYLHDNSYYDEFSSIAISKKDVFIDRMHPIRHILEGASIYTHVRHFQQSKKKKKLWKDGHEKEKRIIHEHYHAREDDEKKYIPLLEEEPLQQDEDVTTTMTKWKYAMSKDYELSFEEIGMVQTLAERVLTMAETIVRVTNDEEGGEEGMDDTNTTATAAITTTTTTTTTISSLENNIMSHEEEERIRLKVITSLSGGSDMPYRSFHERAQSVPWGGKGRISERYDVTTTSTSWWPKQTNDKDNNNYYSTSSSTTTISSLSEGGRLLAGYLRIMKWPSISTAMQVNFPLRLCARGCNPEVAVLHTLEWREKYKPWCVSEESIRLNKDGFIYTRGHSRPGPRQRLLQTSVQQQQHHDSLGHSMVWYRPGLAFPSDNNLIDYSRSVIHAVEMAVSDSLVRNNGIIGRFNVVVDCAGMSSKNAPSLAGVKMVFSVLQDHFPDRLGVLLVANLSGVTQLLLKMVLPFVTEDVRAKIHIIPKDVDERREMLTQFMDEKHIPYYLGGKDEYQFDAVDYYKGNCILSEESIKEYLTTMPYHA